MYKVEKRIIREDVCMLEVGKVTLRTDWYRTDSGQTRKQLQGAFTFTTSKGLPEFCLLGCFERKNIVVLDHLYLEISFIEKKESSNFSAHCQCPYFYISTFVVMPAFLLFSFFNETSSVAYLEKGRRKLHPAICLETRKLSKILNGCSVKPMGLKSVSCKYTVVTPLAIESH